MTKTAEVKTIRKIRVENMESSNGNTVPNQFIVRTDDGTYFQSYSTIIAFKGFDGRIYLDESSWDYSTTTGKYRNIFLRENKKETMQGIKDGRYILTNLN